jgi:hypothetical protein
LKPLPRGRVRAISLKAAPTSSARPLGGRELGGRGGGYRTGWRTTRVWRIEASVDALCRWLRHLLLLTTTLGGQSCPSNAAGNRLPGAVTRNHRVGSSRSTRH